MPNQTAAARVIKAGHAHRGAGAAPLNLDDVAREAGEYLQRAQHEAARLVAEAEAQADAIRRQAQAAGRAEAEAEIEQRIASRVSAEMQSVLPAIRAAAAAIEQAQLDCRTEWETRLVQLAAAMAQRIIRRELRWAPDITLALVREAVQLACGSPQLRIELNPEDYASLRGEVEALAASCAPAASAEVVASRHISRGGCRVETRHGAIDQQIETQLARLTEELS